MTSLTETEKRRIAEDKAREKYVQDVMKQIPEGPYRQFIRTSINSAWMNGRGQILARKDNSELFDAMARITQLESELASMTSSRNRARSSLRLMHETKKIEVGTLTNKLAEARKGLAYPEFCRQPDLCRGKGYCPRDPTCID